MSRKKTIMKYSQIDDCDRELEALCKAKMSIRNVCHISYELGAPINFVESIDKTFETIDKRISILLNKKAEICKELEASM